MAAVRFLLGIVCLVVIGSSNLSDSNLLKPGKIIPGNKQLLTIAKAELWVREATGNNDGARIEEYLAAVGLKKGNPYCASFVSWVFKQAGYAVPRTGWSPALFPAAKLVKTAVPGTVFGIYIPSVKRIAHCGFVETADLHWVGTIEANTNISGGREGDGVYRRLRHVKTIRCFSEWRPKLKTRR